MKQKYLFLTLLFLGIRFLTFSQETIIEKDYKLVYQKEGIEIQFNNPVSIKAFDAKNNNEIKILEDNEKLNTYILKNITPSEIIKLEYSFVLDRTINTTYLAAKSLSTGTISVYFNHPVDTSYAQIQNAVNLSNTLDNMLISYINSCVSTLDIAIYNSYSPSSTTGIAGAINAAYARGVQVRVIYDGSTSSSMIPLLNNAIPRLPSPTTTDYGIMHNKFVLFDTDNADANKPFVWTGSTNWTTAQIDGPDTNSVIIIQDQTLAQGYKIEFEEMWGSNTMIPNLTNSKFGPYKTNNTPHQFIIGGKNIESYFSPSDGTNAKIISTINSANTDIDIATMIITRSDIKNTILSKYNGGLTNINAVVDVQNPTGNQFSYLQSGLLPNHAVIYSGSGIMHHKFMVVDNYNSASDPLVLVGSHNWSTSAETKNDENTLIVHDLNIANQYYQAFAYLYQYAGGVITAPLSVNGFSNQQINLVAYPNPTNGIFSLETNNNTSIDTAQISIYNELGQKIMDTRYSNFSHENIDLSNQSRGLYFISVQSLGKSWEYKIMKQ